MSVVNDGGVRRGWFERIKNMFVAPSSEWEVIAAEPQTVQSLYTGWAIPLAAIPAVIGLIYALFLASILGGMAAMMGMFGLAAASPVFAIISAVVSFVVSLVCLFVFALIIDGLAPSFGGSRDRIQALKVATFTAAVPWAASIALIIPILGGLVVFAAAIYAIYVCHQGLKRLMLVPEDRALGYTAVTIIVGIVAAFLINLVVNIPLGVMRAATGVSHVTRMDRMHLPGGVTVNVKEVERAAEEAKAAAEEAKAAAAYASSGQVSVGPGAPKNSVAPDVLQSMLPELPGYARSETASGGGSIAGLGGTAAHGVYTKGASRIELTVSDLGTLGSMASAVTVNSNKETATGYTKVSSANGRMTTEEYNRATNHGSYSVMMGRFVIAAEGDKVTMEDLKNAVSMVPADRLQAMARG